MVGWPGELGKKTLFEGTCVRRADRLTFLTADAGASPRKAFILAAVEALANRASASEGGVSQM